MEEHGGVGVDGWIQKLFSLVNGSNSKSSVARVKNMLLHLVGYNFNDSANEVPQPNKRSTNITESIYKRFNRQQHSLSDSKFSHETLNATK